MEATYKFWNAMMRDGTMQGAIFRSTARLLLRMVVYHVDAIFAPLDVGLLESIAWYNIIELPHSVFGRS